MSVFSSLGSALLHIAYMILETYFWIIVVGALLSWLVAFDVINLRNRFIQMVNDMVYRLTEPVLAPIRKRLPAMNGLDLSPIVVVLIIVFLQSFLINLARG